MSIRSLLIDLDGVVYVQEKLIPGAREALEVIRQRAIPHRFVTNTTTHSRSQIINRLAQVGITIQLDEMFSAPVAAAGYLRSTETARTYLYCSENLMDDFQGIVTVDTNPTHIVIGDMGEKFSYEEMNRVFTMIHDGAEIIALQKNRFWTTKDGLKLDAGAFIAALEYATGKEAKVFGKPSREFFAKACHSLGLPPHEVTMIGDDLKADIEGAARSGLKTVFVRTGKDARTSLEGFSVRPDFILDSVADLPRLIQESR
jgi:HAD superfamily hydrolase (TIGR01458 family)